MTPQKRLSLISQAAFLLEAKTRIVHFAPTEELLFFTECVRLLADQTDAFIAANAESLAGGLGLPLRPFTENESETAKVDAFLQSLRERIAELEQSRELVATVPARLIINGQIGLIQAIIYDYEKIKSE